jgi:hypothetical protein
MTQQKTCAEHWLGEKDARIREISELIDTEEWYDYGLGFDYVAPTDDQREGYWRFLISSGGPSDEFRFYASTPDAPPYKITYAFMGWFDGHVKPLQDADLTLLEQVWDGFRDVEIALDAYNAALNN